MGRKKGEPTALLTVRLPIWAVEQLRELAQKHNHKVSSHAAAILLWALKQKE